MGKLIKGSGVCVGGGEGAGEIGIYEESIT